MLLANKKTAFAVATITTVILLLSSLSALNCQTSGISTLPVTINTYGDAWSGIIAFDVIGPAKNCALVVMDTNGTILSMRQSYDGYGSTYNIARDMLLF